MLFIRQIKGRDMQHFGMYALYRIFLCQGFKTVKYDYFLVQQQRLHVILN